MCIRDRGCEVDVVRAFDFDEQFASDMVATLIYTLATVMSESEKEQFVSQVSENLQKEFRENNLGKTFVKTSDMGLDVDYKIVESDKDGKNVVYEGSYNECVDYCRGLDLPQYDEGIGFYTDGRVSYQITEA